MDEDPDIAFVKLLTDHQPVIRALVISQLPGAPGVDDVIQETNVVLWTKRHTFELGTNFKAWSLQVARYKVLSYRNVLRQQRWVTLDDDVADLLVQDLQDELNPDPTNQNLSALKTCMAELRPQDRELIMQRYWHKNRLQDFAVKQSRSLNGLKVQLFRLRAALKRCINDRVGEECNS